MSAPVSSIREPLILGHKTYHDITEDLVSPTEKAPPLTWMLVFLPSVVLLSLGAFAIYWTIFVGIGTWKKHR